MSKPIPKEKVKNEFLDFYEDPDNSFGDAADKVGKSRSTLYRWARDDKEFFKQIKRVRSYKNYFARIEIQEQWERIVRQADTDDVTLHEIVKFLNFMKKDEFERDIQAGETSLEADEVRDILTGIMKQQARKRGIDIVEDDGKCEVVELERKAQEPDSFVSSSDNGEGEQKD